jgi:hypothetical protein
MVVYAYPELVYAQTTQLPKFLYHFKGEIMNYRCGRSILILLTVSVLLSSTAICYAWGINVNIPGITTAIPPPPPPPQPVYYAVPAPVVVVAEPPPPPPPQPVYYEAPARVVVVAEPPPTVVFQQPPQLLYSAQLGYYVAVNTPHEMVFVDNTYYIHRHGYWFASPSYSGPFVAAQPQYLPIGLTRYKWAEISRYRDNEYKVYRRDPAHYQGRILDHRAVAEHRATERAEHRGEVRAEERKEVRAEDRKIAMNEKVKAKDKVIKAAPPKAGKKEDKKVEKK